MNMGGQVCREKVAIVASDAPFLTSTPLLQRMGAVLDLEQGQVTFGKLGVTLDLEESVTGHYVIDLIPDNADRISDDTARENVHGSVRRPRGASVKDSETSAETREFSNLICGYWWEGEEDCEKSCRRWAIDVIARALDWSHNH